MATKKYLSLERLTEYDSLIKAEINAGDESVKSYVDTELAKKANSSHNHDDIYYTETEIDSKISDVNTSINNIVNGDTVVKKAEQANSATSADMSADAEKFGGQSPSYYAKSSDIPTGALADKDVVSESDLDSALAEKVNAAAEGNHSHSNKSVLDGITSSKVSAWDSSLDEAKTYTDTKTNGMATTTVVDTKISTHNTATDAHNDIRDLITGLTTRLNTLADSDDTTLDQMSELVAYIKNNKSLIDGITTTKVNVSDIIDNLTTNVANKPLSAAQGVAIKGLIDDLQTAVDGKADAGHIHDDIYYTESEIDTKLDELKEELDVQSDWNQNDESAKDYIKNRTHWVEEGQDIEVLMPEKSIEITNAGNGVIGSCLVSSSDILSDIQSNSTYKIIFNNIEYICSTDSNDTTIGNKSIIYGSSDLDTGEPFKIDGFVGGFILYVKENGIYTLAIYEMIPTVTIHQLDEKFIPDTIARKDELTQSDWSINDETNINYIKNRTHWVEEDRITIMSEQNIDGNDVLETRAEIPFTDDMYTNGFEAIVTYNGIEQRVYAVNYAKDGLKMEVNTGGSSNKYIYIDKDGDYCRISGYISTKDHTLKIEMVSEKVNQLDEKYIPDTIARTTYVDEQLSEKANISDIPTGALADKDVVSESDLDSALAEKINSAAESSHTHAISDITDLQTTLNNAASAISTNTSSISTHTDKISALEEKVGDGFEEISSAEIQALFQ